MNSVSMPAVNAQVSTTCAPWVLTMRIDWPRLRNAALPRRAGMVSIGFAAAAVSSRRADLGADLQVDVEHGFVRLALEHRLGAVAGKAPLHTVARKLHVDPLDGARDLNWTLREIGVRQQDLTNHAVGL